MLGILILALLFTHSCIVQLLALLFTHSYIVQLLALLFTHSCIVQFCFSSRSHLFSFRTAGPHCDIYYYQAYDMTCDLFSIIFNNQSTKSQTIKLNKIHVCLIRLACEFLLRWSPVSLLTLWIIGNNNYESNENANTVSQVI